MNKVNNFSAGQAGIAAKADNPFMIGANLIAALKRQGMSEAAAEAVLEQGKEFGI